MSFGKGDADLLSALLSSGGLRSGGRRRPGNDDGSGPFGGSSSSSSSASDQLSQLLMMRAFMNAMENSERKEKFDKAEAKDVIFVKFDSSNGIKDRPAVATILKVEKDEDGDPIATCRIIGADCHSRPTIPVEAIPRVSFGSAGIEPVLKKVPDLDVQAFRAKEMKRRQERTTPAPVANSTFQEEDEKIVFDVVRNIVIKHLQDDVEENGYAWSCKWDLCMYTLYPQTVEEMERNLFAVVRKRINNQVLKGTGFTLSYFGPCPRRPYHVTFVMDEVPFEDVSAPCDCSTALD